MLDDRVYCVMDKAFSWLLRSCLGGNFFPTCGSCFPLASVFGSRHLCWLLSRKQFDRVGAWSVGSDSGILCRRSFCSGRLYPLQSQYPWFIRLGVLDNHIHNFPMFLTV